MWKSECQYLIRRRLDDSDKQFVSEYGETGSESKLKISSSMYITSTRYFYTKHFWVSVSAGWGFYNLSLSCFKLLLMIYFYRLGGEDVLYEKWFEMQKQPPEVFYKKRVS